MASGGKLHLRSAPPFEHLTVCGRPIEGREDSIVGRLVRNGGSTCQSCWRMRGHAAPDPRRKRAIQLARGGA